jgi:hypothetical protein
MAKLPDLTPEGRALPLSFDKRLGSLARVRKP